MRSVLEDRYSPLFVYQISNGFYHSSGNEQQSRKKNEKETRSFVNMLNDQMKRTN